jgi:hypothetical protein
VIRQHRISAREDGLELPQIRIVPRQVLFRPPPSHPSGRPAVATLGGTDSTISRISPSNPALAPVQPQFASSQIHPTMHQFAHVVGRPRTNPVAHRCNGPDAYAATSKHPPRPTPRL